ncbi:hypothetical protein KKF59_02425 [Patescibacteria group bacterium]|nr:hypothetical protein [Patescibacteria group bacterium]
MFAVGGDYSVGRIIHSSGSGWTEMTAPASKILYEITGFAPNDVFAVGRGPQGILDGILLHYDGSSWAKVPNTPSVIGIYGGHYQAIWGTGSSNLYILGYNGDETDANNRQNVVFHWNGASWIDMKLPIVLPRTWPADIWGYGNELWVVGWTLEANNDSQGLLYHYDGNAWTMDKPADVGLPSGGLISVHGTDACHVVAVGSKKDSGVFKTVVMRYDGTIWSSQLVGTDEAGAAVWTGGPHATLVLSADEAAYVGKIRLADGKDAYPASLSTFGTSAPRNVFRIANSKTHYLVGDGSGGVKISHADCQ